MEQAAQKPRMGAHRRVIIAQDKVAPIAVEERVWWAEAVQQRCDLRLDVGACRLNDSHAGRSCAASEQRLVAAVLGMPVCRSGVAVAST